MENNFFELITKRRHLIYGSLLFLLILIGQSFGRQSVKPFPLIIVLLWFIHSIFSKSILIFFEKKQKTEEQKRIEEEYKKQREVVRLNYEKFNSEEKEKFNLLNPEEENRILNNLLKKYTDWINDSYKTDKSFETIIQREYYFGLKESNESTFNLILTYGKITPTPLLVYQKYLDKFETVKENIYTDRQKLLLEIDIANAKKAGLSIEAYLLKKQMEGDERDERKWKIAKREAEQEASKKAHLEEIRKIENDKIANLNKQKYENERAIKNNKGARTFDGKCSKCRMPIKIFSTRCPYCTTELSSLLD